jgi:hypothetical protein
MLIEYDEEPRLVNRTALRKAKNQRVADGLINEFLISVGEEPDAPKEVSRLRQADNRLLLEQHGSGARFGNRSTRFRTGSPQILGNQGELDFGFDTPSFPDPGRARTPVDRDSRRYRFSDQNRRVAFDRPASARPQGPTPIYTASSVQPTSRTSATDTLPDAIRNEKRRAGAAVGEQAVMQAQFRALMELVDKLTLDVQRNRGTQESTAATQ